MSNPELPAQIVASTAYEEFFVPALFGQWAPRVVDADSVEAGQQALDVACGTGVLAWEAATRVAPTGAVAGLDPSPGMLAVAARVAPGIEWRPAESLHYPDQSFDAVVSQFGLMFFADRRERDPMMAARIGAHITVVYPEEAPDVDLLVERVRAARPTVPPFRLRLGGTACFERAKSGVYLDVDDLDGGYRKLREDVLRPPFHPVAFPPHVTIVHPRTSPRGRDFWDTGGYRREAQEFTAAEVTITAFDGTAWVALTKFALGEGRGAGVFTCRRGRRGPVRC